MESPLIEHCQQFKNNGCIKDCHINSPSAWKSMQLENIVPQSEGNYERQMLVEESQAIACMESCGFSIVTNDFLKNLPT